MKLSDLFFERIFLAVEFWSFEILVVVLGESREFRYRVGRLFLGGPV
jgi:hypothetical protein